MALSIERLALSAELHSRRTESQLARTQPGGALEGMMEFSTASSRFSFLAGLADEESLWVN